LYAAYLNQNYPTGINPAHFIFATNGVNFLFGYWDSRPVLGGPVSDLQPQTALLTQLQSSCGKNALQTHALKCLNQATAKRFQCPYSIAGGQSLLRATVKINQFAAPLAPLLQRYFSSSQESSIEEIVERAYVSSDEVTEYDKILEALLKERIALRSQSAVRMLHPERSGEEVLQKEIEDKTGPESEYRRIGHLQLIQGSVGAGKSLFMERYKRKLQPAESKARTKWATINFNNAPVSLVGAETWLCKQFAQSFQLENPDIDFNSMQVMKGVFSRKIQSRKAIYAALEAASEEQAAVQRAQDLIAWLDNPEELARGLAEYVLGSKGQALVVVMDNVDRLNLQNQLAGSVRDFV
jgi:hypothetical protein